MDQLVSLWTIKDQYARSSPDGFPDIIRKSGASRTFLHLPLNVSKEQYGNVLDDFDVREHCDRFQIVDSDLVTSGAGALIDWQLGEPKSCSKKIILRSFHKRFKLNCTHRT